MHARLRFWMVPCGLMLSANPGVADLVGHWTFEEGQGIFVADVSGGGHHGELVHPTGSNWTSGRTGGGLYFDGVTGGGGPYVSIPDAAGLHLSTRASFAAWVRCDDIQRDAPILAKEGDGNLSYWFGAFGPGHFGVLLDTDGRQPWSLLDRDQGNLPLSQWTHIASTWDGQTVRHYVNGVQLPETSAFAGPLHPGTGPLVIGSNFPYSSTAFKGVVDDLRLYNHTLSQAEIDALVGLTRGLVGYWPLDEGSGVEVQDRSPYSHHGVLTNPRPFSWTNGVLGGALFFDGSIREESTYVAIPDAPSLRIAGSISFSAWVRPDDLTRDAPVLAKEGDGKLSYWFGVFGVNVEGAQPGNFGVLFDLDGSQPWTVYDRNQGQVVQGEWNHIASTWDGATIRHYLNGEALPETLAFAGPIFNHDAFLAIGVNSAYNYTAFRGAVDEVRLYNLALSPAEVLALYVAGGFRITAIALEEGGVRISWPCLPGRTYCVQTNAPSVGGGLSGHFADASEPITVPLEGGASSTNYLHPGPISGKAALFYRVKLVP